MTRTRIWIPEKLEDVKQNPISVELPLTVGLQGFVTAELLNRSGEVINTWKFPNVITNTFMNGIGSGSSGVVSLTDTNTLSRMRAGTGTAIPSGTDTDLQNPIGNYVSSNGGIADTLGFVSGSEPSGNYHFLQRSRLFDFNDVSGNISELAWYPVAPNNTAIVRCLVRDISGSPTFITKTNEEQLRVRYEIRMIVPITTSSINIIVGPTTHSATIYPNDVDNTSNSFNTTWGTQFAAFGGNSWTNATQIHMVAFSSYSFAGGAWDPFTPITVFNRANNDIKSASLYVTNSFFRETTHSFAATNTTVNAYPSGVWAVGLSNAVNTQPSDIYNFNYPWIITFNPPIPQSDIQRLDLYVRWRWARSGTESL